MRISQEARRFERARELARRHVAGPHRFVLQRHANGAPTETEDPKALLKTLELQPPPTAATAPTEPSPAAPAVTPNPAPAMDR